MQKQLTLTLLSLTACTAMAGTFNNTTVTGDADSTISGDKAYTLAVDVNDGANRTINGAVFTGSGGGANPGTNNYATTGLAGGFGGFGSGVSGSTGGLMNNFLYGGNPASYTLKNLRVGETYTTTFYNAAFGGPGGRIHNVTTSDGGVLNNYDQNATPGSALAYTFTATANTMTYTMTPQSPGDTWHHYGFSNHVVNQKALLTDNFYAPGNPNTLDLNYNLAARQGGSLVTSSGVKSWVAVNNTQVGNPTGGIDSGNYLLNAFFTGVSAVDYNFNGSASVGGLSVSFDMSPNSTGNGDTSIWEAINIGQSSADKNGFINGGHSHFGILFRGNGEIQAFDGSSVVSSAERWTTLTNVTNDLHRIELLFSDPGDSNPFDGIGQTTVNVFADGLPVYSFTKGGGGYADNYLNFSNAHIGGMDNLVVAQIIPEPGTAALAGLTALGLLRRRRK